MFLLSADASVLLPIWSIRYLSNSAVQTHCLSSVQCTAESTNTTDCTASRYLHLLFFSLVVHVAFTDESVDDIFGGFKMLELEICLFKYVATVCARKSKMEKVSAL